MNLYYPEGSTEMEYRIASDNAIRDGYDYSSWTPYTGPIYVKIKDIENLYIRYVLNGKKLIQSLNGKLVIDIEPEKYTLKSGEKTKVTIYCDALAETCEN